MSNGYELNFILLFICFYNYLY